MKKSLLIAALVMGAMSVSAQEYCTVDAETAGLSGTAAYKTAGTVFGTSANVTMKAACEDDYKSTATKFQGYDVAVINGTEYTIGTGVTGSANPGGQSVAAGNTSAPTSGCVIQFDVKTDGYLAVIGKYSSNKEYYVFDGSNPVAYSYAMDFSASGNESTPYFSFTVPADANGYINYSASDIDTYVNNKKMYWPEQIKYGTASAVKKNGVGVIIFPVKAGKTYLVLAGGSKITTCGAVFSPSAITSVSLKASDASVSEIAIFNQTSGINTVAVAEADANAPMYNLAGQVVSNDFKGIVIQNGKKFLK